MEWRSVPVLFGRNADRHRKEDKPIVKVSEVGVLPFLLICVPSSDKISLEITY